MLQAITSGFTWYQVNSIYLWVTGDLEDQLHLRSDSSSHPMNSSLAMSMIFQ
jgi:hypothetical protein